MAPKPVDKLRERFIKQLRYRRTPANIIAIELHDFDFQKKNFKPFQGEK